MDGFHSWKTVMPLWGNRNTLLGCRTRADISIINYAHINYFSYIHIRYLTDTVCLYAHMCVLQCKLNIWLFGEIRCYVISKYLVKKSTRVLNLQVHWIYLVSSCRKFISRNWLLIEIYLLSFEDYYKNLKLEVGPCTAEINRKISVSFGLKFQPTLEKFAYLRT